MTAVFRRIEGKDEVPDTGNRAEAYKIDKKDKDNVEKKVCTYFVLDFEVLKEAKTVYGKNDFFVKTKITDSQEDVISVEEGQV